MPKGFSAHPPAIHSHATNTRQRAGQVSSAGTGIGNSGVHSNAYGGVGQSTASSQQKFAATASNTLNKFGNHMNGHADKLDTTAYNIKDTEAGNASKFKKLNGNSYSAPKGPYGGGGGGSKYGPNGKPGGPSTYKPPAGPWDNKQWYGNSKYEASQYTRDEYAKRYPNYWQHRDWVKNNIRPETHYPPGHPKYPQPLPKNHPNYWKGRPEYNHINTADLVGVRGYTTNDYYKKVNQALRTGDTATIQKYEPNIKTAVSGLNGMPRYQGETVRKLSIPPNDVGSVVSKYKPGRTVQEPTFTSTTAGKTNSFPGNVVMHIQSKNGHPIQNLSEFPTEGEVLFGPGTKFNVNDRWYDKKNDTWHIGMSEAG